MSILILVVGLAMLIAGAELLVRGGGALALALKVPALIVGLTVVAFGTSAPELAVSVSAAVGPDGATETALANITGSNIANILLVLGIAALVRPLIVDRALIKREIPALLLLQLLIPLMCLDGVINRWDGLLLLAVGVVYNGLLIRQALRNRSDALAEEAEHTDVIPTSPGSVALQVVMLVGGLTILVLGATLFVDGAFDVATSLGWSDRFIGLTVIALGTSAPEMVTGAISAWRGETELAMGNSIGSNILNISMVLAVTALILPIQFEDQKTWIDLLVANGCTLLLVPLVLVTGRIGRVPGGIMIAAYITYLVLSPS
ncbi:MAG: calcium/sodium antiporter [Myxococcota bacterium]